MLLRLLSLLLCLMTAALWAWSYRSGDGIVQDRETLSDSTFHYRQLAAYSMRGGVMFNHGYFQRVLSPQAVAARQIRPASLGFWHIDRPRYPSGTPGEIPLQPLNWLGFHFGTNHGRDPATATYSSSLSIVAPFWFLTLALVTPTVFVSWRRHLRRRARSRNRCVGCGYDLRGSLGRCPECGTEVPAEARV